MNTRRKALLTAIAAGAGLVFAAHAASAQQSPPAKQAKPGVAA